jgi:hypothetical protein
MAVWMTELMGECLNDQINDRINDWIILGNDFIFVNNITFYTLL